MTIRFTCPNCGVAGSVDASAIGKWARCKYCDHRFTIPAPGAVQSKVYELEDPAEVNTGDGYPGMGSAPDEALTAARGAPPVREGTARPGGSPGARLTTIRFACPNCGVTGSADASAIGKSAQCKYCDHRFTIPAPGAVEPKEYELEEPAEKPPPDPDAGMDPFQDATFAPTRGDEPTATKPRSSKRSPSRTKSRTTRDHAARSPWPARLACLGVATAIAVAGVARFAPNGMLIAACAVIALGCVLILVGYAMGAYGAFSEDFVYGFLYLVIPLYTAYYIVTRWEDLWVWFACMTTGVGLVLIGIEMARWGGVVA
jgi:transcription elongation factor Elf1